MVFVLAAAAGGGWILNGMSARDAERDKVLAELRGKQDEAEARNRSEKERLEKERDELQAKLAEKIVDAKGMGTSVTASGSGTDGSAIGNGNQVSNTAAGGSGGIAMANASMQNSTVSYVVNNFGSMTSAELKKAVDEMTKQEGAQVVEALKGSGSQAAVSLVSQIFRTKFAFSTENTQRTAQDLYGNTDYCNVAVTKIVPDIDTK